ncbi:ATP-dependent RNA helicase DBP5, partial [Tanacetum coccineum]
MSPVKAKPSKRASKDKKNDTKLSSVKMPCLGLKQFKVNLPDDKSKIETTKTKIIDLGMTKDQVVVFVPKSELADMLYDSLREYRFLVSVVHSDLTKQKREKMVNHFYEGFTHILITTDLKYFNEGTIPRRVDMVVNFDLPVKRDSLDEPDIDLYLLRLPEKGVVFYLLSGDKENMIMEKLERHLDRTITELRSMFEKQAGVEKFDLIQSFHACKQEEGKPVADYVLKMKGYVEKLERLGYVLPQDITVGLILNGLTKDFAGFVSNYKMHNMGKTIGEIHAMLMEYEKSLPKKAETPQVMMIKKGKIQKANKKSLKVKGKVIGKGKDKKVYVPKPTNPKPIAKERPAKDDACHHCKEVGHWKRNCPVYLAELLKKKKQVGDASSS